MNTFWLVFALLGFMATGWFIGYTMSLYLHKHVKAYLRAHAKSQKSL